MFKKRLFILFLSASLTSVAVAATQSPEAKAMTKQVATAKLININTASADQLESLPHVGQKIAQRIIAYRKQHGNFASLADLTSVRGISLARVKQIEGLATATN